ncbi:MAG: hypothetical protein HOK06_03980 [Rhodospirillaceae bacterium]|nr:hypothetical protein [Rhodospirillaceae bacterium]
MIALVCGAEVDRAQAHVKINGEAVPRPLWRHVRPKKGVLVEVRVVPAGGGGGGQRKNPIATILTVAVMAASVFIPAIPVVAAAAGNIGLSLGMAPATALSFGRFLVSTATTMGGRLLVNSLAPPPQQSLGALAATPGTGSGMGGSFVGGPRSSPTLSLTGSRNRLAPYEVIPVVLGRHKVYPPLGAEPYTEIVGDDQYLRLLFTVGYGPLQLDNLKIGETPLSSFDDVETEIRHGYDSDAPIGLFPKDVHEEPVAAFLDGVISGKPGLASYVQRRSEANADELSVDIGFPTGVVSIEDDGTYASHTVTVSVEYQDTLGGGWMSAGNIPVTDNRAETIRRGLRWSVSRGQYDVRLRRTTSLTDSNRVYEDCSWSVLRTITNEAPVQMSGLAQIAMRIKASDQLNGVVDQLNLVATSILPCWNGTSWVEQATANVSALARFVLSGKANARPIETAKLIDSSWQNLYNKCQNTGHQFNGVIDFSTTVGEVVNDVLSAAHASLSKRDGKYGVVIDEAKSTPVQMFTPRNSWGFRGDRVFPETVHGVKVRFVDAASGYRESERIVYADGYGANNAKKFEVLELWGQTSATEIYKKARRHLAEAVHRAETYELNTDIEHIICTRGDLVRVTHDVPGWGLYSARIKTNSLDGSGDCDGVTLDDAVIMEGGKSYSVRIRTEAHGSLVTNVVTAAGETRTLSFLPVIPAATMPTIGDLLSFGEVGQETVELLVKTIEPGPEMSARLTLIDYSPQVFTAHEVPIPPWDPQVTGRPASNPEPPAKPIVETVRSDETVLVRDADGTLRSRIVVALALVSGQAAPAAGFDGQIRPLGSGGAWRSAARTAADTRQLVFDGVEEGLEYDLRVRSESGLPTPGLTSDWALVQAHKVVGKSTPPADVTGMTIEGEVLRWSYGTPPIDFAGFLVRYRVGTSVSWHDAVALHDGMVTTTEYGLTGRAQGIVTLMVKAVDSSGNESSTPAYVIRNLGDIIVDNLIFSVDQKAADWPGTLGNGAAFGGTLKADDAGNKFWSNNSGPFWKAVTTDLFWTDTWLEMVYTTDLIPTANEVGARLLVDTVVSAASWEITWRSGGDDLVWDTDDSAPCWKNDAGAYWLEPGPFKPWSGQVDNISRQKYEYRIRTAADRQRGEIAGFVFKCDVPDQNENFEDVVIASAGTRLPIAKSYRTIANVQLTLQDDGGTALTVRTMDKSATEGPLIKCFNAAGVAVAGLVDANIQGVPE